MGTGLHRPVPCAISVTTFLILEVIIPPGFNPQKTHGTNTEKANSFISTKRSIKNGPTYNTVVGQEKQKTAVFNFDLSFHQEQVLLLGIKPNSISTQGSAFFMNVYNFPFVKSIFR